MVRRLIRIWWFPFAWCLFWSLATVGYLRAQEVPKADCAADLDKLRSYASLLKNDRDQKEAALAEAGVQVRNLQAEIEKLKKAAAPAK